MSPTTKGQNSFVPSFVPSPQFCPITFLGLGLYVVRRPSTQPSSPTLLSIAAIDTHVVVAHVVVTHVAITHIVICCRRHRHNRCFHCYRCFYRCRFLVDCCMRNPPPHLPHSSRRSMTSLPTSLFAVAATATATTTISAAIAAAFSLFVVL